MRAGRNPMPRLRRETFIPRSDIPRAGWSLTDVWDSYAPNFVCQNCHFPHVRFVHDLKHAKTGRTVQVGCVCAEHLTQDFATPRLREKALRSIAGRRMRWPTLNWKRSQKGNLYLRKQGMVIVVRQSGRRWAASYTQSDVGADGPWTPVSGWYDTPEEAKMAAFDALYLPPAAKR